jgi:hypothetical protein
MSDPFKEFVEKMARLAVPEDDTEESRGRREAAAFESGTRIGELDESDIIACADDDPQGARVGSRPLKLRVLRLQPHLHAANPRSRRE